MIVLAFGLSGIGIKRGFLRGSDTRYPLTTIKFLFFRAIVLGKGAACLHMNAMFGLAGNSDWLISNYPALKQNVAAERERVWQEARDGVARELKFARDVAKRDSDRASKAEAENYALRKVIQLVQPD